jgi:hypothetical protein
MTDHGARDHATWSASATARNVYCPGALALSAHSPPQPESIHAARGTACHQISEKCLRGGLDPAVFLGEVEQTKEHAIAIDEELVESARMYVNHVASQADYLPTTVAIDKGRLRIEQRFSLETLHPPFDAGGTADAVILHRRDLEVVDLKNGMGVVDVTENPQLRTYALGAMLANPGLDVERITVTIVQPRAPHKDGRIRSETFHVADLLEWTADLLAAMHRSKEALDSFPGLAPSLALDEWTEKWLRPGKCKFCPAEGFCPALKRRALDVVGLWFDDFDKPRLSNRPDERTPEVVAKDLDVLDLVEDWVKARRAYAHSLAESGVEVPGYVLVEKHGHRKWAADEEKVVIDLQKVAGLSDDQIYDRKLRSPAQIEKIGGVKVKKAIECMWSIPVTGTNLVAANKSSRPAAKSVAEKHFEAATEN